MNNNTKPKIEKTDAWIASQNTALVGFIKSFAISIISMTDPLEQLVYTRKIIKQQLTAEF